jgi:hypothetical protein
VVSTELPGLLRSYFGLSGVRIEALDVVKGMIVVVMLFTEASSFGVIADEEAPESDCRSADRTGSDMTPCALLICYKNASPFENIFISIEIHESQLENYRSTALHYSPKRTLRMPFGFPAFPQNRA